MASFGTAPDSEGSFNFLDPVGSAREKLAKSAGRNAIAGAVYDGFSRAELNAGQQTIAFLYVADAMISQANECLANEDPDADVIADAGFSAHYAAEQSLSELINDIASQCAEAIEAALEAAGEGESDEGSSTGVEMDLAEIINTLSNAWQTGAALGESA